MLLELDVHQRVVPLNVHQIVALIVFPDMVRSTSPKATACTRPPARLRPVPQLLNGIKEAQGVLDCAHSGGGDAVAGWRVDGRFGSKQQQQHQPQKAAQQQKQGHQLQQHQQQQQPQPQPQPQPQHQLQQQQELPPPPPQEQLQQQQQQNAAMQAQQQMLAMAAQAQGGWAPHAQAATNMTPHQMQMQQATLAQQQVLLLLLLYACIRICVPLPSHPPFSRGTLDTLQAQAIAGWWEMQQQQMQGGHFSPQHPQHPQHHHVGGCRGRSPLLPAQLGPPPPPHACADAPSDAHISEQVIHLSALATHTLWYTRFPMCYWGYLI